MFTQYRIALVKGLMKLGRTRPPINNMDFPEISSAIIACECASSVTKERVRGAFFIGCGGREGTGRYEPDFVYTKAAAAVPAAAPEADSKLPRVAPLPKLGLGRGSLCTFAATGPHQIQGTLLNCLTQAVR